MSTVRSGSTIIVQDISDSKIDKDKDVIIAFIGPTGSGKSNLIDTLTGQVGQRSSSQLESKTQDVRATRIRMGSSSQDIVLVDTPGFDDTFRSDTEILTLIAQWLKKTYKKKIKLSGIVYTHRITDNRMSGSPHRNLRMFKELCGDDAASHVAFVSTMWDKLRDTGVRSAEAREEELRGVYWKPMIRLGARSARFLNTSASAWDNISHLIPEEKQGTLIQTEMVDKRKEVKETKAGMELLRGLEEVLREQQTALEQLEATSARFPDQPGLDAQRIKIHTNIQNTASDIQELKLSFSQRIVHFLICGTGSR